ncbi:RING-H2 finger protein ATL74-like [Durio zibethinus]|uniref:RING-type E3 ubiquitin transferase n=1 Tax=Durio zibethinus TaxID=66656 RepID=A0A6P5X3C9_DURZI|nr:RING-H2 finger protein ATL74-like [Durio zibethinus]
MHRRLLETEVSLPPAKRNKTHDSYTSQTNFDTNMVIILAALLCALIFALGLNSIVRCALCCSRRFALDTPEQAAARLAATGLKKRDLKQIPVAVYRTGVSFPSIECPICLGKFLDGEKVRMLLKCNHGFHVRCIDTWLVSHPSCPNFRHSLLEHDTVNAETIREVSARRQPENGLGDDQHKSVVVVVREGS